MTSPLGINRPMGNTYHPRGTGPLDPDLVARIRCRAPGDRLPIDRLPRVGQRIGVRMDEGGLVLAASVTRMQSLTDPYVGYAQGVWPPPLEALPDPNIWRVVTDQRSGFPVQRADGFEGYVYELVADPWPMLTLRLTPPAGVKRPTVFTEVREERMTPWGGWLPASEINDPAELALLNGRRS
jgi:hypothetical protein